METEIPFTSCTTPPVSSSSSPYLTPTTSPPSSNAVFLNLTEKAETNPDQLKPETLTAYNQLIKLGLSDVANLVASTHPLYYSMQVKEYKQVKLMTFRSNEDSVYQQCRAPLVDWMAQVAEVCQLKPLTLHMSVAYLDSVLDLFPVSKTRLQLVGICCILIAAKMEEQEDRVPSLNHLNHCCGNVFTRQLICQMESLILNTLHWGTLLVCPHNFLDYFSLCSLHPLEVTTTPPYNNNNDDTNNIKSPPQTPPAELTPFLKSKIAKFSYSDAKAYLDKLSLFFLELSLQHSVFRKFLPSVVAASAVCCARNALLIQPIWPPSLYCLSLLGNDHIKDCTTLLWELYEKTFPSSSSPSSTPSPPHNTSLDTPPPTKHTTQSFLTPT
eukprot:TRINITY_DN461_c0_g2_i1.p1 TRINITY_DN461_c0_g2~~TRINITY_DN461_c0_g2_i1.p1  ORF type:complete len:383 (-),score=90.81 TRINITY_DN461_c0_g2_i1:101-1249(-)